MGAQIAARRAERYGLIYAALTYWRVLIESLAGAS